MLQRQQHPFFTSESLLVIPGSPWYLVVLPKLFQVLEYTFTKLEQLVVWMWGAVFLNSVPHL